MSLDEKRCTPCEGNTPPLPENEEEKLFSQIQGWELKRDGIHRIEKQYSLKDFREAMLFVNKIAEIANTEDHHPDIFISYSKVRITLSTHAVNGLSENDFIVASKIDKEK